MLLRIARKYATMHKMISDSSQEMTIFFDKKGRITFCNNRTFQELGFGKEIYQHAVYEIFRNAITYEKNKLKVIETTDSMAVETIAYRKNQTCFPVELIVAVINDRNKYYGLCTARNITDRKEAGRRIEQLQNELELLNKNRNEIAANITHELRTPVNGIMGLSNNLLDTELQPSQMEIVRLIKHCCNNMNTMINDLLDYTKIINGKMLLEQREFEFRECINTILEFNRPRINDKGLKLLVYISDDIPEIVIGDELRLSQILNNLLSNAVKFTIVGQIALEIAKLTETAKYVELFIMVIDTGIGISLEEQDKLFHSFSQVDGSITRRFGGTGLGLAITKMLVEAMGGTIRVDSEKDKGSTFSFSVKLGLPEGASPSLGQEMNRYQGVSIPDSYSAILQEAETSPVSEDISSVLRNEAQIYREKEMSQTLMQEGLVKRLSPILEKLSICIDMESWSKAEELAYNIKKQIPVDQGELSKLVFRLLLEVRKENHEASASSINELKTFLEEG